jgi:hypothetical protein
MLSNRIIQVKVGARTGATSFLMLEPQQLCGSGPGSGSYPYPWAYTVQYSEKHKKCVQIFDSLLYNIDLIHIWVQASNGAESCTRTKMMRLRFWLQLRLLSNGPRSEKIKIDIYFRFFTFFVYKGYSQNKSCIIFPCWNRTHTMRLRFWLLLRTLSLGLWYTVL